MWLCLPYGLYSVVAAHDLTTGKIDPTLLLIRGRDRSQMEALQSRFPLLHGLKVIHTPDRDYAFRIICEKATWVKVMAQMAEEVTWDNFKNEATRVSGHGIYVNCLHDVWSIFRRLQLPPLISEVRGKKKQAKLLRDEE